MKLLYIEPTVVVFEDLREYLFYNTLTSQSLFISKIGVETVIRRILQNEERRYSTEVTDKEVQDIAIKRMISQLRQCFMGDLIIGDYQVQPVMISPMAVFQRIKLNENGFVRSLTSEGFNCLREVTIFNDSVCDGHCKFCNMAFRQTYCCYREESREVIPLALVHKILKKLHYSKIYEIRFVGAQLAQRTELLAMLQNEFSMMQQKLVFYFSLGQWMCLSKLEQGAWLERGKVMINVFEEAGERSEIEKKLLPLIAEREHVTVRFLVTSREEYEWAAGLAGEYTSEIVPIYTGHNTDFFESEVFMNAEDILADQHTMKMIHGRQYLNYHYFGKILIKPNGEMAGIWDQPVGNVNEEEIAYLAEKLLLHDSVWLKVRKEEPCSECLYRWLCPSPSDYEQVMGRPNLCHVK